MNVINAKLFTPVLIKRQLDQHILGNAVATLHLLLKLRIFVKYSMMFWNALKMTSKTAY